MRIIIKLCFVVFPAPFLFPCFGCRTRRDAVQEKCCTCLCSNPSALPSFDLGHISSDNTAVLFSLLNRKPEGEVILISLALKYFIHVTRQIRLLKNKTTLMLCFCERWMLWPLKWEESRRSLSAGKIDEWLPFPVFQYQPFVGLDFTNCEVSPVNGLTEWLCWRGRLAEELFRM